MIYILCKSSDIPHQHFVVLTAVRIFDSLYTMTPPSYLDVHLTRHIVALSHLETARSQGAPTLLYARQCATRNARHTVDSTALSTNLKELISAIQQFVNNRVLVGHQSKQLHLAERPPVLPVHVFLALLCALDGMIWIQYFSETSQQGVAASMMQP